MINRKGGSRYSSVLRDLEILKIPFISVVMPACF
jgi:hypothetical protein